MTEEPLPTFACGTSDLCFWIASILNKVKTHKGRVGLPADIRLNFLVP